MPKAWRAPGKRRQTSCMTQNTDWMGLCGKRKLPRAAAVEAYRLAEERVRQVKMDTEERLRLAENEMEEMKRRRDS